MGLKELVHAIEQDSGIGIFSKKNKALGKQHTYDIPFALKPSQQILVALGGDPNQNKHSLLTPQKAIKTRHHSEVTVTSFNPEERESRLIITGERLDRLFKSAKIYVNTALFPEDYYKRVIKEGLVSQAELPDENKGISWKNLAVGLCHAQEIDLLVGTYTSKHGRAHTSVKDGTISQNTPALLLLSSPMLNLNDLHDKALKEPAEQVRFIKGMYRNLFHAALTEGREYLVMSAADLKQHGGKHAIYFELLMEVAAEYPKLNIIYNAGSYDKEFKKALEKASNVSNIAQTTKNIVFVAANLTEQNILCALHNPSSSSVVYGLSDVGEHWQSLSGSHLTKDPGKTLQAFIGTISTAPLGSYGVNRHAYTKRFVEKNLSHVAQATDEIDVENESSIHEDPPAKIPTSTDETGKTDKTPTPDSKTDIPPTKMTGPGASGIFSQPPQEPPKPVPPQKLTSALSEAQLQEINKTIGQLLKEINSSWPYPNKDVKQIKVNALSALIAKSYTMSISEAIADVKEEFPRVCEGRCSTRTADLLDQLELAENVYVM